MRWLNKRCRVSQSIVQANSKSAICDFLAETIATHPPRIRNALRLQTKMANLCDSPLHTKYLFSNFFPVCTCVLSDHAAMLTTHKCMIMMPRRSTRPTKTQGKTGFLTSTWWLENEHKCLVSLRWTEYQYKNSFALTVLVQMSSCTLLHGIQNSMEAILVCHPSPSTKRLDWVAKWCVQWRLEEGAILPNRHH